MLKKVIVILLALTMLSIALVPSVRANGVDVYTNLDKVQYALGEQGKIFITIKNAGEDPIEIRNVSIYFESWMWYTVDGWDELGNQTIVYSEPITVGSNTTIELDEIGFTVPSDGRAVTTEVNIWIYTNKPSPLHEREFITVVDPSTQNLLRALDNIVVLLTVGAILAIISAIIVAAAIFLSGRRPGVTWQKEE